MTQHYDIVQSSKPNDCANYFLINLRYKKIAAKMSLLSDNLPHDSMIATTLMIMKESRNNDK